MSFQQLFTRFGLKLEFKKKNLITYWRLCDFISIFPSVCVFEWVRAGERESGRAQAGDSLCSSLCCRRPWTCQSPRSWPAGFPRPGSSWWPSLCGQSAARPGTPCQQQSVGQCAASGTVWAPPGCCVDRLPWALRRDRATCDHKRNFKHSRLFGFFYFFFHLFD